MSNTEYLLYTCLVLLIVIIIWINLIVIYYFAKIARISFKRRRSKKAHLYKIDKNITINIQEISSFITNLSTSLSRLSSNKVGALIVLENRDNLQKYIELGNKVSSSFFPEFVYSIFFNHDSALHDGAMIVRNFKIASLSSYLPVSKRLLSVKYGARHRAAFGIAERTDALAFVVSETTGAISFMCGSDTTVLSSDSVKLANQILDILFNKYGLLANNKNSMIVEKIKERIN